MERIKKLIEALNSDKITGMLHEYYEANDYALKPKWKCSKRFTKYLKAYYLKCFLEAEKEKRDIIFNEIIDGNINVAINNNFLKAVMASEANTSENIDYVDPKELLFLDDYLDDDLYEELSDNDDDIRDYILKSEKIITFDDLVNGSYEPIDDYVISNEEIATIEKFKELPELSFIAHEINGEEIDERVIVYQPNKKNPQYGILFEDGTIIIYYNGDIRVLKFKIEDIVKYVKLQFIDYWYNASEDNIFWTMVEGYENFDFDDAKLPLNEMNEYTYDVLLAIASETTISTILSLHQNYSKKMIRDGQKLLDKLGEHILHYHI